MLASSSSNSWILSLKLLLISAGVVSVSVAAKFAVPATFSFAVNDFPAIWSSVVSWLKPPYLYIIINGIIITIVASTRFQTNHHPENQSQQHEVSYDPSNAPPPVDLKSELPPVSTHLNSGVMVEPPVTYESKRDNTDVETVAVESTWNPSKSVVDSSSSPATVLPEFKFPVTEKRLVSSRFAHNRKPPKNIPEGARALRLLKQKKHETLDTTWKMITDGRHMPATRQFRKSDTFENLRYDRPSDESTAPAMTKLVRKSETFKDRTGYENQNHYPQPPATNLSPSLKLKKDVSLSSDELNRRVEAFIKKFNEDMRLQRQESLDV